MGSETRTAGNFSEKRGKAAMRSRDRASARLIEARGWIGERRLVRDNANVIASSRLGRQALSTQPVSAVVRQKRRHTVGQHNPFLLCCPTHR